MKRVVLAGILTSAAAHANKPKTIEVCRITDSERFYCQKIEGGKLKSKGHRPAHTVENWMAVPCKQLKQVLPAVSCKRQLKEVKLGEALEQ